MTVKLVAIDIDGTLVDDQKKLSQKTIETIKKVKKKGVYVVLCTGRPVVGIIDYLKQLDLLSQTDYAITYNGAQVENIGQKKVIATNLLTTKDYEQLLTLSKKAKVKSQIVTASSKLYTTDKDISPYTVMDAFYTKMPLYYRKQEELICQDVAKFMLVDTKEKIDLALPYFSEEICANYYTVRSEDCFFEFMHKDANKGQAMLNLANYLGIKQTETMALGDQKNDLTMLKLANLGVAMENASAEIKKYAQKITLDNNHDGVAEALEKYVL